MLQVEVPYKKFEKDLFRLKRIYSLLYLFMHTQCKINWLQENNISIRSFSVTMSKSKKRIFNFVAPESERNFCMSCISKYCTVLSWKQLNQLNTIKYVVHKGASCFTDLPSSAKKRKGQALVSD